MDGDVENYVSGKKDISQVLRLHKINIFFIIIFLCIGSRFSILPGGGGVIDPIRFPGHAIFTLKGLIFALVRLIKKTFVLLKKKIEQNKPLHRF